jgi:hypothetical protein
MAARNLEQRGIQASPALMFASPPKAEIRPRCCDARFVPIGGEVRRSKKAPIRSPRRHAQTAAGAQLRQGLWQSSN